MSQYYEDLVKKALQDAGYTGSELDNAMNNYMGVATGTKNIVRVKEGDTLNSIAAQRGYSDYKDAGITTTPSGDPNKINPGDLIAINKTPVVTSTIAEQQYTKQLEEARQITEYQEKAKTPQLNNRNTYDSPLNQELTTLQTQNSDPYLVSLIQQAQNELKVQQDRVNRLAALQGVDPSLDARVVRLQQQMDDEIRAKEDEYAMKLKTSKDAMYKFGGFRFQSESADIAESYLIDEKISAIEAIKDKYDIKIEEVKRAIQEDNAKMLNDALQELRKTRESLFKEVAELEKVQQTRTRNYYLNKQAEASIFKTQTDTMFKYAEEYATRDAMSGVVTDPNTLIAQGIDPAVYQSMYQKAQQELLDNEIARQKDLLSMEKAKIDMDLKIKDFQFKQQKFAFDLQKYRDSKLDESYNYDTLYNLIYKYGFTTDEIKRLQAIDKKGTILKSLREQEEQIKSDPETYNRFKAIAQEMKPQYQENAKQLLEFIKTEAPNSLSVPDRILSAVGRKDVTKEVEQYIADKVESAVQAGIITQAQSSIIAQSAPELAKAITDYSIAQSSNAINALPNTTVYTTLAQGGARAIQYQSTQEFDSIFNKVMQDIAVTGVDDDVLVDNLIGQTLKQRYDLLKKASTPY